MCHRFNFPWHVGEQGDVVGVFDADNALFAVFPAVPAERRQQEARARLLVAAGQLAHACLSVGEKHFPLPWRLNDPRDKIPLIIDRSSDAVAALILDYRQSAIGAEAAQGNAILIAAASTFYHELENLIAEGE